MIEGAAQLFPPSPRVVYRHAPLIQVICQLRFPPLLSIESRPPVEFQERIRGQFPLLEKAGSLIPTDLPPELAQLLSQQGNAKAYQFLTEDRTTIVTLTPESLALSTVRYSQWENFRHQMETPLGALVDIYRPSFFSRIGLRYQDAIDRASLGLSDAPWSRLLRNSILGELALPAFEQQLEGVANRTLRLKLPDGSGSLLMRHGLGQVQGRDEICYNIDIDFFTERKTEVSNVKPTLDHFNGMAGRAFRWFITEELQNKLEPIEFQSGGR